MSQKVSLVCEAALEENGTTPGLQGVQKTFAPLVCPASRSKFYLYRKYYRNSIEKVNFTFIEKNP